MLFFNISGDDFLGRSKAHQIDQFRVKFKLKERKAGEERATSGNCTYYDNTFTP